jgi:hypothetical protein
MPDSTAILWAAWFTAIATIGAAVVAGWLGFRDRLTHLSGAADLSRQGHAAHIYSGADILIIELANRGVSRVVVAGAYWCIGWFKPDILAVSVPKERLPLRIESQHGASFPIVLNDVHRTLICAARKRNRSVALIVRTTTGGEVRCRLTRDARQWISSRGE